MVVGMTTLRKTLNSVRRNPLHAGVGWPRQQYLVGVLSVESCARSALAQQAMVNADAAVIRAYNFKGKCCLAVNVFSKRQCSCVFSRLLTHTTDSRKGYKHRSKSGSYQRGSANYRKMNPGVHGGL